MARRARREAVVARSRGTFSRLVAEVVADGMNLSDWLLVEGLVRRYDGESKAKWWFCGEWERISHSCEKIGLVKGKSSFAAS